MHQLAATAHLLGLRLQDKARARTRRYRGPGRDRGSVTIEQVLWAVAVIAIVGIVVLALRNYVTAQAAKIN